MTTDSKQTAAQSERDAWKTDISAARQLLDARAAADSWGPGFKELAERAKAEHPEEFAAGSDGKSEPVAWRFDSTSTAWRDMKTCPPSRFILTEEQKALIEYAHAQAPAEAWDEVRAVAGEIEEIVMMHCLADGDPLIKPLLALAARLRKVGGGA